MNSWIKIGSTGNWRCPHCNADFKFAKDDRPKYSFCPSCGKEVGSKDETEYNVDLWFCMRYKVKAFDVEDAEDAALKLFDCDCAVTENFPFDIPDRIVVEEVK